MAGRFFSCGPDDAHLLSAVRNAVRCVERNSVRAGLLERAKDYPRSKAAAHCGLERQLWLADTSERASRCAPGAER